VGDDFAIGNLLRELGVTQAQLDAAVAEQKKRPGLRIGEALVDLGAISHGALDAYLMKQQAKRTRRTTDVHRFANAAELHAIAVGATAEKLGGGR